MKCGKGFASNGDLAQHIRREDKISLLTCEVCGATALDKTRMRDHMDRHEGAETLCNICGKAFRYRAGLTRHKKCHI